MAGISRDRRTGKWIATVQQGERRIRRKGGSSEKNPNAIYSKKGGFKTKKEAKKWAKEEEARLGIKSGSKYNHKKLNGIIDSAVKDGRMTPERAEELKSISNLTKKRNSIASPYITILDDGGIEYKPLKKVSHWRSSPYLRSRTKRDKSAIIQRIDRRLKKANELNTNVYEELTDRLNLLKDVNSAKDLANWESDFNTSYDELLGNKPIYITDPDQIDRVVKRKVNDTIRHDKKRNRRYKIDDGSWVTYKQLQKLREQGVNPTILEEILPGYFPGHEEKIRADFTRQLTDYLKGGGDLRKAPQLGHKYPLVGFDESGNRVLSSVTTASNVGAQDRKMNLELGGKVTQEMLDDNVSEKFWRGRGFLPGLLGMATLPLWLLAPDRAQAMVDTGQQNISSTANKYLPQGLMDYAKRIGSTVDNYIGQSFPTNTLGGIQANIGQMFYEGAKQTPGEVAGLIDFVAKNPEEYLNPERNLSWAERMRLMQSGRSY